MQWDCIWAFLPLAVDTDFKKFMEDLPPLPGVNGMVMNHDNAMAFPLHGPLNLDDTLGIGCLLCIRMGQHIGQALAGWIITID